MNPILCYEHPFSRSMRVFVRFEQLVAQFNTLLDGDSALAHQTALLTLSELFQLASHLDLKAEVFREADHLRQSWDHAPPMEDLPALRAALEAEVARVGELRGQLNAHLKNHAFFTAVRQRATMPGGINSFDLPVYHYWLHQPADQRRAELAEWIAPYRQLYRAVAQILTVVRACCRSEECTAEQGYFAKVFQNGGTPQLLQVHVAPDLPCYPEVSAGKQRCIIRFFEPTTLRDRPGQTGRDVPFRLVYCGL